MIGAIYEFERMNLLERQREGIIIGKREGKFRGRSVKELDEDLFNKYYEQYTMRKINKKEFAEKLQISPISLLAPSPAPQQEDRLVQEVTDQVLLKMKEILGEKYE